MAITFNYCLSIVGSIVISFCVDHSALKLPFVTFLQALDLKEDGVRIHMFQSNLLACDALAIYGIRKPLSRSTDDVDILLCGLRDTELKFLLSVVACKAAHIAGDVEWRAQHAIQGPGLCFSEHFGLSWGKHVEIT